MRTYMLFASLSLPFLAGACASAAPFSVPTSGREVLATEVDHLFAPPEEAMARLADRPLDDRVRNLALVYEEELGRAQRQQGGLLNTTLSIFGIALPISGTVAALALSDPGDIETVSVIAGTATTVIMGLNLILKPQQRSAAAARCQSFLDTALDLHRQRWGAAGSAPIPDDPAQWATYLTMRSTLEPMQRSACGGGS